MSVISRKVPTPMAHDNRCGVIPLLMFMFAVTIAILTIFFFMVVMQSVQSTLIQKDEWRKLDDVGSSPLNAIADRTSKNIGAAVSNIWSVGKKSSRAKAGKNDLVSTEKPTLDAFKIVSKYPAIDSQLLKILFAPNQFLEKMTGKGGGATNMLANSAPVVIVDALKEPGLTGVGVTAKNQNFNSLKSSEKIPIEIVEVLHQVTDEPTLDWSTTSATQSDEIIHITELNEQQINKSETVDDTVIFTSTPIPRENKENIELIEIPKITLIKLLNLNPSAKDNIIINGSLSLNEAPNKDIAIEMSTADPVEPVHEAILNENDTESSVIVGSPPNLLIDESIEFMQKVAELPDPILTDAIAACGDDCDEFNAPAPPSEDADLLMASNEVSLTRSENDDLPADEIALHSDVTKMELPKNTNTLLDAIISDPEILNPTNEPSTDGDRVGATQPTESSKNVKRAVGDEILAFNRIVRPAVVQPKVERNPSFIEILQNESSAEKSERVQKSLQRLMHFVTVVGHVDSYLSKRFRSGVKTFARMCESEEEQRGRQRRSRYSL